jgi:hypothetical protein
MCSPPSQEQGGILMCLHQLLYSFYSNSFVARFAPWAISLARCFRWRRELKLSASAQVSLNRDRHPGCFQWHFNFSRLGCVFLPLMISSRCVESVPSLRRNEAVPQLQCEGTRKSATGLKYDQKKLSVHSYLEHKDCPCNNQLSTVLAQAAPVRIH